jgi:HAD superfamily hydrolase (TIGR01509 family)
MFQVFGKQPDDMELKQIVRASKLLGTNKIGVEQYVRCVSEILVSSIPPINVFQEATISYGFPPSPEIVKLVKKVRENGIKVSLLSDMYMFELEKTSPQGRSEGFDYTSFSSEIGFMKTDLEAFTATLNHFGVKPEDTLFVDDVFRFVQNAASLGIDTIWADKSVFKSPEQLAETIRMRLCS